ncbi:MAG: hypothetical protein JAY95_09655, partial [Candidatus Thiodiazotropha taylori]|nr:hypothetical protein [Candidatus Thiodiazotropha taylori]
MSKTNKSEQSERLETLIAEEQTRILFQQAPISNATVFAVATLFYFILIPHIDTGIVEIWVVSLFAAASFRLALWWLRKRDAQKMTTIQWRRAYLLGCLLVGVAWSLIVPHIYLTENLTIAIGLCM